MLHCAYYSTKELHHGKQERSREESRSCRPREAAILIRSPNAPGSHPIETGIGAAVGGAATGAAVGTVAGPVGTAVGAAVGAVAGGYAGKGIGELIDPTTEDNWLRENFSGRPYVKQGETFDTYHPAYHYGAEAESSTGAGASPNIERDLERDWESRQDRGNMTWCTRAGPWKTPTIAPARSARAVASERRATSNGDEKMP